MEEAKRENSPQSDDVEEEQNQSPTTNGGQANGAPEDGSKESALLHNIKTKGKNAVRLGHHLIPLFFHQANLMIFLVLLRSCPQEFQHRRRGDIQG
jgi:hypothetical protein